MPKDTKSSPKKRTTKKHVVDAIAHIHATFNNTIITITDRMGHVLATSSAGACNFKGSRKSTPFAGQEAVKRIVEKLKAFGIKRFDVRVKGPGSSRDSAVRELANQGFAIDAITDKTPLPHNGCRPPKQRRV